LQEWGDEEDDEDEGADEDDDHNSDEEGEENGVSAAQSAIDSMFANQRHIPRDDTNKIRERLDSSLKRLKLMILMHQAVIKRRFKTLPALLSPESISAPTEADKRLVQCLDEVLKVLKKIPDITDELANAFYELDAAEIDKRMDECFFTGFAAVELLVNNWAGKEDEFTAWARKFQVEMKKSI
jgi:hypothetical protein